MKPTPKGWPRIAPALYYQNAGAAIDWLCRAFGFEVRMRIEGKNGRIEHSELVFGDGLIMVGEEGGSSQRNDPFRKSPKSAQDVNTQNMMLYVDDVEAHAKRAREAGATIVSEPKVTDYGEDYWTDKGYEARDLEGHHWWFYERLRNPKNG